jgi:hypothetical protein
MIFIEVWASRWDLAVFDPRTKGGDRQSPMDFEGSEGTLVASESGGVTDTASQSIPGCAGARWMEGIQIEAQHRRYVFACAISYMLKEQQDTLSF